MVYSKTPEAEVIVLVNGLMKHVRGLFMDT